MNWKPITGYEGRYSISDTGIVRSEERLTETTNGISTWYRFTCEREKISRVDRKGYVSVCLCTDGKNRCICVHRLVAHAFIPNPDNLKEVNHINGDKTDNRVENLEWSTRSRNIAHSYQVLKTSDRSGTKNGRHVLTEDDVRSIRLQYETGMTPFAIAQRYGIDPGHVRRIVNRKAWKNLD